MFFSRILSGVGRLVRSATPATTAPLPTASARRAIVACTLIAGAAVACTARGDAAGARENRSQASGSRQHATVVADTLLANADVYAGWRSFNINCQSCHGFNAVASDAAPDLRNSVRKGGTITRAQFHEVVTKGRMAKGMPAWGALLDAKQIDQIYAYLLARSSGALGAGQPSVGGE
ncbi:MAG TPA: c-type cytochrome [Gemmatimonadaceae bacterium]